MSRPGPKLLRAQTDLIVHHYRRGLSLRAVAARLGFSVGKVRHHLEVAGVETRPCGRPRKKVE